MASITEQLAQWACARRREGFDSAARGAARWLVLDWLGCALGGLGTPVGGIFLAHARAQGQGPALALRAGARSVEAATQLNGALSHIVEMDDVERASVLHPATVVIPAALALAQTRGASGAQLLDAIVAGYEVMVRVGSAVGARHYELFHNTATCGPFGSAVAAAWLLELDEKALVWALGNAGTQAAGLWQFNADGALTKPLHAGRAAAHGVLAAQLAALGLSGPARILEGAQGFFAALAPQGEPQRVLADLGGAQTPLAVQGISLKPHASCRHTHAAIDAALQLHAGLKGETPVAVRVDTYQTALGVCHRPQPQTPAQAKFSLEFCVAAALLRGDAGLAAFEGDGLADSRVLELARRVELRADAQRTAAYPAQWSAALTVTTAGGEQRVAQRTYPKGDPEAPLTATEQHAKFRQLAAYGGVNARHADALIAWVTELGEGDVPDYQLLADI